MKVLAVDIGGTSVKILVSSPLETFQPRSFPSGTQLTPEKMVSGVLSLAADWSFEAVAIGYPGPVSCGKPVAEPHNLAPGWVGFDFEAAFGCPVRVINDAAMQALGSYRGGTMLFLGLGTGLGSAMVANGVLEPMELARLPYRDGTYEDYTGIRALERFGEPQWREQVTDVVSRLQWALQPDDVVLGGGNVHRLETLPPGCRPGDNANAFLGAFRLWEGAEYGQAGNPPGGCVLVTGATGQVGPYLVRLLLAQGERKVVASNLSGSFGDLRRLKGVETARADVGSLSSMVQLVQRYRPRTIYHLGAMLAPDSDFDPQAGIRANALGTWNVLEAARHFGVQQVILASSVGIFSAVDPGVTTIDDYSLTRPDTIDGASKLFSEHLGLFYRRQHGLDFRAVRLPVVVGPKAKTRGHLEYFNRAIEAAVHGKPYSLYVGPGTRIPIVYVRDAARALVELARTPAAQIKTVSYIVLGPNPTARELVDALQRKFPGAQLDFQVNQEMEAVISAVTARPFSDAYARQEWGWSPSFGLAEMLEEYGDTVRTGPRS